MWTDSQNKSVVKSWVASLQENIKETSGDNIERTAWNHLVGKNGEGGFIDEMREALGISIEDRKSCLGVFQNAKADNEKHWLSPAKLGDRFAKFRALVT